MEEKISMGDNTVKSDNPVNRLVALLNSALRHSEKTTYRDVWSSVFEIEPTDTPRILYLYGKFLDLIAEAKSSSEMYVEQQENVNETIYLEPFKKVEDAFTYFQIDGQWAPTRNHLNPETITALNFIADNLSRSHWTNEIEQEELEKLKDEVDSLINNIWKANIGAELKSFLLESLLEIQRSIIEYRIRGIDGLEEALNRTIGAAIRHSDKIKEAQNDENVKKWFEIISTLEKLIAFALKTKELIAPIVTHFLTAGDS